MSPSLACRGGGFILASSFDVSGLSPKDDIIQRGEVDAARVSPSERRGDAAFRLWGLTWAGPSSEGGASLAAPAGDKMETKSCEKTDSLYAAVRFLSLCVWPYFVWQALEKG